MVPTTADDLEKFPHRMPAAYAACPVSPVVIIQEGQAYVGLTYEDSITQAICEEKKIAYIEQLLEVLSTYKERHSQKEENEQ